MNDKILHALFGFIIAWRLSEMGLYWVLALIIVILFGLSKEIYDYYSYGKYDYKDMLATIIGGVMFFLTKTI